MQGIDLFFLFKTYYSLSCPYLKW
uniref:Uncharacterized protein n=1 Tax=Rhizophora mucronata TaxID=61149 RepID=A0A2P2QYQ3_RHIMU